MPSVRRRWPAIVVLTAILGAVVLATATRSVARRDVETGSGVGATTVPAGLVGFSPGADILWASPADQARELDLMAATGAHWLRLDFPWPSVQPAATQWNWTPFDTIVAAAHERGFEIVGVPGYTPTWAKQTAGPGVPPAVASSYAAFVAALAARYGPQGVHVWEVWNEPNLEWAWGATPDPAAYAALLKATAGPVRAADPLARILTGGLAPAVDAAADGEISPITFVEGIYAAGAKGSFDAVAVHPYSYPASPRDESTAGWNTFERLPLVHDVMAANGDGAKTIWLTEYGAPTGTASGAVSLDEQADLATEGLLGTQDWPWAGPIFWYAARDLGTDPSDREANFGLLRRDFSQKPAYAAFTATIDATSGTPSPYNDLFVPPPGFPVGATEVVQPLDVDR